MPFVKNGAVTPDPFLRAEAEGALPEGPALVPFARLLAEGDSLLTRNEPLGVVVPNSADVSLIQPFLARLAVVALDFPKFRDGRAFSQARLLRERFGFAGELRAVGNVLHDQLLLMLRCGFDAFEVQKDADAAAFAEAAGSYSVFYQPTGDGRATALQRRLAAGA